MGHSDLKTTMGYYKFLPAHLDALVAEDAAPPDAQLATGT